MILGAFRLVFACKRGEMSADYRAEAAPCCPLHLVSMSDAKNRVGKRALLEAAKTGNGCPGCQPSRLPWLQGLSCPSCQPAFRLPGFVFISASAPEPRLSLTSFRLPTSTFLSLPVRWNLSLSDCSIKPITLRAFGAHSSPKLTASKSQPLLFPCRLSLPTSLVSFVEYLD